MLQVVLGALVRDGRVLLAHRSPTKRAYPDLWDLPGGVVEPDESPLDALARELREELGVTISTGSTSHLCGLVAPAGGEPVQLDAWLVGAWDGAPTNAAPDEHDDLRWFALEELPPLAHEPVRAALVEALGRPGDPAVVTLCGSMRFAGQIARLDAELTLAGHVVLSPTPFDPATELSAADREVLDRVHLRKVAMADEVLVVNVDGYVGESTRREIEHARSRGIPVRFLEP